MHDTMPHMLEKVLRGIALSGLFAVPFVVLIVAETMFFPFITGKNFAFRILVEISAGAWLALALIDEKYRPRRSWILGSAALFVFIMVLANAFGEVPFKSFWSNYERMDGWVTLAHFLLYLVVLSTMLTAEKLWNAYLKVSLGISVFLALYGLMQLFGVTALGQGGKSGLAAARVDGTFGNPIYMAVYMLFHIAIAAHLWWQSWKDRVRGKRVPISVLYGSMIVLQVIALCLSGTRGTILGLIGGVILGLLIVAFSMGSKRVRNIAIASIIGVVVLGGLVRAGRDTPLLLSINFLDRLSKLSLSDATVKSRVMNAGMAWEGVKERPLLGWGQENYALVFDRHYDPRMYSQEPWFDRTHNIFFDWFVTGGFLGLFSYLSIYGVALYVIWRRGGLDIPEKAIFTGLLAGYFFHNLTVFDNLGSYIMFAIILAYIVWRERDANKTETIYKKQIFSAGSAPFVAIIVGIVTVSAAWWANADAYFANKTLLMAVAPQQAGIEKNLEYFKKAIAYDTLGNQEAREQLAQIAVQVAGAQGVRPDTKQQFFKTANEEMLKQEQASPLDARFPLFRGVLLAAYGDLNGAKAALEHALELAPQKQSILYELARNAQMRGDSAAMLDYFRQALEAEENNPEARLYYASEAIRQNDLELADRILAPIIESGEAASPRIAAAYLEKKRYDKIAFLWEARVKKYPSDAQQYFTLAAAYYAMGDVANAVRVLEAAKVADPSQSATANGLIQQVKNGTAKIE